MSTSKPNKNGEINSIQTTKVLITCFLQNWTKLGILYIYQKNDLVDLLSLYSIKVKEYS